MRDDSSTRTGCLIAGALSGAGCVLVLGVLGATLAFGWSFRMPSRSGGGATSAGRPAGTSPRAWPTSTEPEDYPDAPSFLPSDITVVNKDEPYVVTGSSAQEIRDNLNRIGPTSPAGRHDAMTHWYVRWTYPFDRSVNSCATGPVKVSVTIRMQMPKWSPPADASGELTESWNRYITALQHHEDGHKNHGLQAARDVLTKLERLGARESCDAMNTAANAEGNRILDQYREKDRAYDRRTRHGATQGARFP